MRFTTPTKWEQFLDGFETFISAYDCYISNDNEQFWDVLSTGWMDEYIYPYDDCFGVKRVSNERLLRLGVRLGGKT
jgi:hypothetical protein